MKRLMLALVALLVATVLWGSMALAGIGPAFAQALPAQPACDHALPNAQAALPFNVCFVPPGLD